MKQDNDKLLHITRNTFNRIVSVCKLPLIEVARTTVEEESIFNNRNILTFKTSSTLNSTYVNYIKNGDSGDFWLHDRNQKIKLGKIITILYPSLNSTQIEMAITLWKSAYTVDTSTVKVSFDVADIYDMSDVGGSCMAHKGEFMKIYEDLDCKVAYIEREGCLQARALFWDNNIYDNNDSMEPIQVLDRIFFRSEQDKITLTKWAKENKIPTVFPDDTRTLKGTKACYEEGVPYIDNMYYLLESKVGGEYQLSNDSNGCAVDCLQATTGESSDGGPISGVDGADMYYCEDTGNSVHEDEVYYCNSNDCYYQYDEDLVFMDDGYYHIDDERLCYTEDTMEYRWVDDCYYVESNYCYYEHIDELIYCEDLDGYELADNTYYCEDEDCYYADSDGLYCGDDGLYYSSECEYNEIKGITDE